MTPPGEGIDPIRVFLVEDHDLVRRSVAQLIEREPDLNVIGEASTAAMALLAVPDANPHVAMIDVRLEDGDGIALCRQLRDTCPHVQCIMLTSFSDDRAVVESALAGAAGFVLKQIRSNYIVESIRAVAGGQLLLDKPTIQTCLRRLRETEAQRVAQLTTTQRQLFALIGEGRSDAQIADIVGSDTESVGSEISVLLRRLGMMKRSQLSDAYLRTV